MTWKWEELTAPDFAAAVEKTRGVCIIPCGVIEKHGAHLPLGTDSINGTALAVAAAELEPAVVFPFYYFGMIQTAKPQPGTISYSTRLLLDILEESCAEAARNGLHKVVLLDSHGGNQHLLGLFMRMLQEKPRDFTAYLITLGAAGVGQPEVVRDLMTTAYDHHGGEIETSFTLHNRPDLVRMELTAECSGADQKRLAHLGPVVTSVDWYARFPEHYAGDATRASKEKGATYAERLARRVAALLKAIKEDRVTPGILEEFHAKTRH